MKHIIPAIALCALMTGCSEKTVPIIPVSGLTINILLDGTNALGNELFTNADGVAESIIAALAPDGHTPVSCNVFLIKSGGKKILVDTGFGGELPDKLEEAGLEPADISDILITHAHFDHVGGLMSANGTAAFPNATLHITAAELEFWKNAEPPLVSPELAAAVGEAYQISIITPDGKTPVAIPEIIAFDAAGHTPGHVVFLVIGKHFLAGDLLHSSLFQFAHPEIYPAFDSDPASATAVRKHFLARAADEAWTLHLTHVHDAGAITRDGDGFKITTPENHPGR